MAIGTNYVEGYGWNIDSKMTQNNWITESECTQWGYYQFVFFLLQFAEVVFVDMYAAFGIVLKNEHSEFINIANSTRKNHGLKIEPIEITIVFTTLFTYISSPFASVNRYNSLTQQFHNSDSIHLIIVIAIIYRS